MVGVDSKWCRPYELFENRVTEYEVAGLSGSWKTAYTH